MRQAIERAVQELVHPVVDRSIKIAMTTCEQIVRKDFALDSEESRMRIAAHHMMRNLTAGMAMITCREPLLMSISTNLKNSFASALRVGYFLGGIHNFLRVPEFLFLCMSSHLMSFLLLNCKCCEVKPHVFLLTIVSSTQRFADSRYPNIYWFKDMKGLKIHKLTILFLVIIKNLD